MWILSSICDAIRHEILYSVYLKVDCFQSRACWGDNEHAGETVWIPNNKFISLLLDAAQAWTKRIVMSSGYGNFQTGTEQIRSKETSTNCLLAKHRCIGKRGLCALCNRQRESSVIAYTHTTIISSMSCKEWVLHNGCCASLMYLPFKTMAKGGAAIPGGNGGICYWMDKEAGSCVNKTR